MAKKIWKKLILEKEGNAPLYLLVVGAGMFLGLLIIFLGRSSSPTQILSYNSGPWQYANRNPQNEFQVYFGKSENKPLVEFRAGNNSLALVPEVQAQEWEKETVNGNDTLRVKNAYPQADVVYQIKENGLKEEIILYQKPTQKRFAFSVASSKTIARLSLEDEWKFYATEDAPSPFAKIPQLVMEDALGVESSEIKIHHLIKDDQQYFEIEPSADWLNDPQRVYPVIIDPSVELPEANEEIVSKRTLYAKVFDNPGPGHTWVGYISPIHYQEENNNWEEIDITFRPSTDPEYNFSVTRHNFKVFFKKSLNQGPYLKTQFGSLVFFQTLEKNQPGLGAANLASQAFADNNTITYPEVYPDIDLRYTLTPTEIKEEFIIKSKAAAAKISSLSTLISLKNGVLEKLNEHSLAFLNFQKMVLKSPAALMYEDKKAIDPEEMFSPPTSTGVIYQVKQTNPNEYRLTKELTLEGQEWLADPSRTFPVILDPATLNPQVGADGDDAFDTGSGGTCDTNGLSGMIRLGDNGSSNYSGGFRFQSINVPAEIEVTDSDLEVYGNGVSGTGTVITNVYLNLVADCAAWSGAGCVTSAARTTNYSSNWTMQNSYTWYSSPAFNSAIEEVASTSNSWSANNDMCAMIIFGSAGDPNYARIEDYANNSARAAKLSFTYNTPTPVATNTPTLPPYATPTVADPGPFKFEGVKLEDLKIN